MDFPVSQQQQLALRAPSKTTWEGWGFTQMSALLNPLISAESIKLQQPDIRLATYTFFTLSVRN